MVIKIRMHHPPSPDRWACTRAKKIGCNFCRTCILSVCEGWQDEWVSVWEREKIELMCEREIKWKKHFLHPNFFFHSISTITIGNECHANNFFSFFDDAHCANLRLIYNLWCRCLSLSLARIHGEWWTQLLLFLYLRDHHLSIHFFESGAINHTIEL